MRVFLAIVVGLAVMAGLLIASWLLSNNVNVADNGDDNTDGDNGNNSKKKINGVEVLLAIGLGIMVGMINFFISWFAPGTIFAFMAPVCFGLMLGFTVLLMIWWWRKGRGNWRALLAFIAVVVITYFTTKAAAIMTAALVIENAFLVSLFVALPGIMLVVAIGFLVAICFYNRYKESDDETVAKIVNEAVAIAVAVIAAVIVLALLISQVKWSEIPSSANTAAEVMQTYEEAAASDADVAIVDDDETFVDDDEVFDDDGVDFDVDVATEDAAMPVVESTWYKFYHYETLKNESLEDDFDFGLTAYAEGTTAEAVMQEHFARIEQDLALGAATFAAFDVRLGTDFMIPGEHYDQNWSDGYWTTKINQCATAYAADQNQYSILVQRWENFVRTYARPTLVYAENVTDQMYMITLTSQNEWEAPEVIIAETDQPSGHILTYAFLIKGNEFDVPFRSDCGFQPTNVAEPMRETPQVNPVRQASGADPKPSGGSDPKPSGGSDPQPSGGGDPSPTPTPKPTPQTETDPPKPSPTPQTETDPPKPSPTPTPTKEPSQDPVNQGSANKGGGQNKSSDGAGETQPTDPRVETPTGSQNDNNHGYSEPATVTPATPPVVEEHKQESVVTDEKKTSYKPDAVTDGGPSDPSIEPTSPEGDGEFTPAD